MQLMSHTLKPALGVGIPLAIAFALLANTVGLPDPVTVVLYILVIAIPVLVGLRAEARREPAAPTSAAVAGIP